MHEIDQSSPIFVILTPSGNYRRLKESGESGGFSFEDIFHVSALSPSLTSGIDCVQNVGLDVELGQARHRVEH